MSSEFFGPTEERAIISLALDSPEFFSAVGRHIEVDFFQTAEAKYVYTVLSDLFEKHEVIPTREILRDVILHDLTADDEFEEILEVVDRKSKPREVPIIKSKLLEWTRERAYGMLYTEAALNAIESHDYNYIEDVFESARRIADVSGAGLWFFQNPGVLFQKDLEVKLTSGFPMLDRYLNDGGPTKGDVICFMGPTGIGKSLLLIHGGVANYRINQKVLHVTMELSELKTAQRYMGAFTNEKLRGREERQVEIERKLMKQRESYDGDLVVYEFAPDEISIDTIYQLIQYLRRTKQWSPDVVILDYLQLMLSRKAYNNREEYIKQKRVATEIRGLARNENVLVMTATQTNRAPTGRNGDGATPMIDLNRIAESYGQAMPMDYVVSINQSDAEYRDEIPQVRLFIAKNRNGPKFETVRARIDYSTMTVREDELNSLGPPNGKLESRG